MIKIDLESAEKVAISELTDRLAARFDSVEHPAFGAAASLLAHELPARLRASLLEFKRREPTSGVFLLAGYDVDDERLGPTPRSWSSRPVPSPALREEALMLMLGSLFGDPIAWQTQQDGQLVHDILPMPGYENEQLGCGSEELLWWHTEDAFHPYRGDYLGMLCLRNPDQVATTVASLDNVRLDPVQWRLLFEPHFHIRPDESHLPKHKAPERQLDDELCRSYQRIDELSRSTAKIPVLFGAVDSPYMRLDPFFMEPADDPEAQAALDALIKAIGDNLQELVLQPGDICLLDNFRVVHGRKPFRARYDGRDRWLKRINVTRDLRKSRDARVSTESLVLV